jgi:hypothetical protein
MENQEINKLTSAKLKEGNIHTHTHTQTHTPDLPSLL